MNEDFNLKILQIILGTKTTDNDKRRKTLINALKNNEESIEELADILNIDSKEANVSIISLRKILKKQAELQNMSFEELIDVLI